MKVGPLKVQIGNGGVLGHTCETATVSMLPFGDRCTALTDIHEHLPTLYLLTLLADAKTVVELGVRGGESTLALLYAVERTKGEVFSFDINPCPDAMETVRSRGLALRWRFRVANDLEIPWARTIDHLVVDTSHTLEQTTKELEKFGPTVRPGGFISMHDSTLPGVKRAALDFLAHRMDFEVCAEYANNNGLLVFRRSGNKT